MPRYRPTPASRSAGTIQSSGCARRGRADDRGLLAHRLAVEADAALALQRHHARVGDADAQHAFEQPARERAIEAGERGFVDRRAVLAEQLEQAARLGLVVAVEVRRAPAARGRAMA